MPPRVRALSFCLGVGLVAALLALPGLALAHTELVTSDPPAGSTVAPGLNRLVLAFTEPPEQGSTITLYTGVFELVPGVTSYVANGQLWADLSPGLAAGTYTVQWAAVSLDGHSVEGSYQFAVAAPPPFPWAAILVVVVVLIIIGAFPFFLVRGRRAV